MEEIKNKIEAMILESFPDYHITAESLAEEITLLLLEKERNTLVKVEWMEIMDDSEKKQISDEFKNRISEINQEIDRLKKG